MTSLPKKSAGARCHGRELSSGEDGGDMVHDEDGLGEEAI